MKNRKRKRAALCAALLAALMPLLLTGCRDLWPQQESAREETRGQQIGREEEAGETEPPAERALTEKELAGFETYLNDVANNGFLCSDYEDVRRADLNEVFYNGAGIGQQPLTDELRRAYEEQAGEIMTDTIRLTTEQIDGFLREKTGYGLEEFENPPDWVYLDTFDVWMTDHGDTNRMGVSCEGGVRETDGTVILSCSVPGNEEYSWISAFTVMLEPGED